MTDATRPSGGGTQNKKGTQNKGELVVKQSVKDADYFLSIEDNKQIPGKFSGSIAKNKAGNEIYRDGAFTHGEGVLIYEGKLKNNKPHGKGKTIFQDGSTYEGDFIDGKMNGKGKHTYSNNDFYEGEWKDDKMEGKGKYIFSNNDFYEGEWKDNKMEGKGKYTHTNGDIREGTFLKNKLNGYGKLTDANGNVYEGNFKNGQKNGKGKYTRSDGSIYEGEFENDKIKNGPGKYTRSDGSIYEGEFSNGQYNGKGKLIQANGDIYEGEFSYDKKNGEGKITYRNGVTIGGNFKDGTLAPEDITNVDFGEGRGSYEIKDNRITYRLPGGIFFSAPFVSGVVEVPVTYNGEIVGEKFNETGWLTVGKGKNIHVNRGGSLFIGEVVFDGKRQEPRLKRTFFKLDGSTFEENFDNNAGITSGKLTQANGSYKWGKFNDKGELIKDHKYYEEKIEENGDISETSVDENKLRKEFRFDYSGVQTCYRYDKDSHLIGQDILLDEPETYFGERAGQINFDTIDDTRKLCSVNFDINGFSEGPVVYYSYDVDEKLGKTVGVDYDKLNRALSEGKNWEGLLESGAIVVTSPGRTFEEVQQTFREVQQLMFKNRAQRGGVQGFNGGYREETNLGVLANLKDSESLKRIHFQKLTIAKDACSKIYESPTKFLESLGISAGNIGSIGEDPISVSVNLQSENDGHTVTLALDMKKIKKIVEENGFEEINNSNETLFKCFDTSRLITRDPWKSALGGLVGNTALVEDFVIQKGGTCWKQSTATTIAVAENPELLKGVKSTPIIDLKPASSGTQLPTASAILSNDMSVAQLREHLDISENNKIDLGTGKNLMEHVIYPAIIGKLKEFSKTEKLLEEYNKRVQSLREEHLKNKSKEYEENFEKLARDERDKLSKEIVDENKETEKKKEEKELKELGETAKKNWKSFSGYLKNNSGKLEKFGKSLEDICEDLQHNGENIEYDPAETKRAIDLARTIAEELNGDGKKSLEDEIKKIEESNRAYVGKSLENSTRILRQGLDNTEKLNERIESLESEIMLSKMYDVNREIESSLESRDTAILV
ncbi:MAG: hypothetical protein LBI70_03925 [Rickettsiales bacterium]|jgi:hypothetical protein|nr:hypothetical protein [Rickettsiales bacterium]